ncbi:hypothetical protein NPX13_g9647 [Xylaria arbuscula]|uniref:Uncharacterized protein n=1 Tax=Xylaria arbuscula TaxID=114810 RepID=A0A9W8TIU5_9PEZI|nr:hypothetical protein NPX13_g9647 [Xylaria arbuscula]
MAGAPVSISRDVDMDEVGFMQIAQIRRVRQELGNEREKAETRAGTTCTANRQDKYVPTWSGMQHLSIRRPPQQQQEQPGNGYCTDWFEHWGNERAEALSRPTENPAQQDTRTRER